ncbi:alpha/beta hydrolase [Shinella curvata]|uniref:Alpha/beta hydrolase n=1 Tax=Shinella curvata TaxID=1817964 RepID=A0ABT8XGJ3_9HYPH|nr:alpha/beta hydrolase [Shinella curvata]MCJ8053430.1 alpha/beta hydrolase [Shinella curvata]MDO6122762.1 alpha/beta hydrolase [Shinella curvata]
MTASGAQAFRDIFFSSEDGLRLHARDYPAATSGVKAQLPVICLPGLSRNARDFHQLALMLAHAPAAPRRVVAVDYRGRGLSQYDPSPANYNVMTECRDVIALCDTLGLKRCLFIGTSRGGLILHVMAALRPDLITATVLNDIGPEIEAQGLMEIRDYLGRRAIYSSFEEAANGLAAVHGATFPALDPIDWLDMAHALYTERAGALVPDYDPALNDQLYAIDFSKPLPTLWPQFESLAEKPMLVIRGEHSKLFSEQTLQAMMENRANVTAQTARGHGHAPLLHHRDVFPSLSAFLPRF